METAQSINRTAFTFLIFLHEVLSRSLEINANSCFKDPMIPLASDGIVLFGEFYHSTSTCYIKPSSPDYYLSIRIDDLNLEQDEKCASLEISEYSVVVGKTISDSGSSKNVLLQRPSDSIVLVKTNCKDYGQFVNQTFTTSKPGRKIMVDLTEILGEKMKIFRLIITSFYVSSFSTCRADYFLCWNTRGHCIPNSLTCDGVNNCLDGSDEKNFSCTGTIGGLPVAWFVILMIVTAVCLISSITTIIIFVRRNRVRRYCVTESIPMTILPSKPAVQHPLMNPEDDC